VREVPQTELTPFYPRSPYGVAKAYAHYITVNYRESYDLFAVSGILFNHECIGNTTPLMVRRNGYVDVALPDDLVAVRAKGRSQQSFEPVGLEIWDGAAWTPVRSVTATRRRTQDLDHTMVSIQARAGAVQVTAHHHMLNGDGAPLPAREVQPGMALALAAAFPPPSGWSTLTAQLAEFLGLLAAEGYISERGRIQFTNNDEALRTRVAELWSQLFLGTSAIRFTPSGWNTDRLVGQVYLSGDPLIGRWLRQQLYASDGSKRVPALVLNAPTALQRAFLEGYYAGDGLKAGKGLSIKTSSAVLAQGLCWLYANQGQCASVYLEHRGAHTYYQLNLGTATPRGAKGQHLRKAPSEVRCIAPVVENSEWVFDLETGSGTFCAGVGRLVVHNSPRRGREFSTRKVCIAAARIKLGLDRELRLGNLDSERDWGYAPDYVRAMWLMLQQEQPDDFVIATGRTHSVRRLCEAAFGHVNLDWQQYVTIDPALIRPAEVDQLVGDPSKAKRVLGWEPTVSFEQMIAIMVQAELDALASAGVR
jgi:GDPmannose 4,6-dehydratase